MRGIGDVSHMTAELLKQLAPGFAPQYIPYSQMAQAVRDLMTGDLAMTMPLVTRTLVELHNTGKIKLLAVTSPKRLDVAPDMPTAIEAGVPNMVAAEFFYLFAPAGTPVPVLQHLNDIARAALTDDEFKKKLANAGLRPAVHRRPRCQPPAVRIRARALAADGGSLRRQNQLERSIRAGPQGMNDASGQAGLTRSRR